MKRILAWMCILIFVFSFPSLSESVITFTDDSGETITLKNKPQSTAVLFSSYAQMWLLSGGDVSVSVGETVERGFASDEIILVDNGAGKRIDLERLVLSGADFIIGSYDIPAHKDARDALRKTGVPFALFRVESIEDYLRIFEIMTRINLNEKAYQVYGEEVYEEALKVIEKAKEYKKDHSPQILFIRSGSGYSSAKAKTKDMHFAAKMLDELGARNIADDVPVIIDGLSFEEILMKDPEAIFISLMGDEDAAGKYMKEILSTKEWQMLTAVRNGRCYFLEKELFQFKPNHKWADAYEKMAEMLYPEWTDE